ncbi:MAG: alcohol dehydrogenase catalytic domain-containing protein, partial [Acidimicrobiales bacterium]
MKAVRSTDAGIRVVDAPDPEADPESDAVVVEMASIGICGSDFGYIRAGSRFILGHELAGTTPDGTAVAVEGVFGCGACGECRAGTYNRCATVGMRVPGLSMDGGMAERMVVPAHSLVPLPTGLALRDAALVEPAAVACHALRLGGVGPGARVAVV